MGKQHFSISGPSGKRTPAKLTPWTFPPTSYTIVVTHRDLLPLMRETKSPTGNYTNPSRSIPIECHSRLHDRPLIL